MLYNHFTEELLGLQGVKVTKDLQPKMTVIYKVVNNIASL